MSPLAAEEVLTVPSPQSGNAAGPKPENTRKADNGIEPEPLRKPTPPPTPYPVEQLGPILQPACLALQRVIQAPDAVCAAGLLAAASLAAQGIADVVLDGRRAPCSLWMLTIAESGERKSAIDTEVMRSVRAFERELAHGFAELELGHQADIAQWQARQESAKTDAKSKKGAGLADALREIGSAPLAPMRPVLTVADFTAEGLVRLFMTSRPSLGAFTDEAALVFGGHGMSKENIARTAGTLSKLWDEGVLDRIRAADGAVKLYGRRLALHLMAQPVIAERALSDEILSGQGFMARCLLSWPSPTAGTRHYCDEDLTSDPAMRSFHAALDRLLREELPIDDPANNELAPRELRLDGAAKSIWVDLHDGIEAEMGATGKYAQCKPYASKAPQQALRVAGVLALIENPAVQRIDAPAMSRAAELVLWHLDEAVRVAGTAALSAEVRNAEALLAWAHATRKDLLHSGGVLQFGPACVRERSKLESAMSELIKAGWADRIEGGCEIDGKHRRTVWAITPKPKGWPS